MGNDAVPHRVLVVDDDDEVRTLVRDGLIIHGFEVSEAGSAAEARRSVAIMRPDVVLLDLTLPDGNGLDLLRELHAGNGVAVIVLSGRGDEADRVAGLELGADDYVTKPFLRRELVARINAVIRRSGHGSNQGAALRFGSLVIDAAAREALLDGRDLGLTAREFALLHFLACSPRTVFSSAQLLDRVWGSNEDWQSPATVSEHVHRIRQKLETHPKHPEWIVTMKGAGYRFEPRAASARQRSTT